MKKKTLMKLIATVSEDRLKIEAIGRMVAHIQDADVMELLCREAIETDSHRVRDALIEALKNNEAEANRRFAWLAVEALKSRHRRWALVNLSLMGCCSAKQAVMRGLQDPHRSVRVAAAFNAGLYYQGDVAHLLDLFFERDRPLFIADCVCQAVKPILPFMKKLATIYSDYYHHRENKYSVQDAFEVRKTVEL